MSVYYESAHQGIVAVALETGTITESTNGTTAAALPAIPSTPLLIGYTDFPAVSPNIGNSKGFAIGDEKALYDRKGAPAPTISVILRPGSGSFLTSYCQRTSGVLPSFAVFVGVAGVWTQVYRFCKVNDLSIALQESTAGGQGGEITATVNIWSPARPQELGTPVAAAAATLRALGRPLMWHDCREFTVVADFDGNGTNDAATSLRRSLMGLTANLSHNLERKGVRPDWGDAEPLSRSSYELLEHQITAGAEIQFHKRLARNVLYGAVDAQNWGNIVLSCSDVAATMQLNMTLENALVTNESIAAAQAGQQLSHAVSVACDTITIS